MPKRIDKLRIDKLTEEQKALLPVWRDKWIDVGLRTGETDWETFEENIKICYHKANVEFPNNIIRVQSPLVGALAAGISGTYLKGDAVGGAVRDAVHDAVHGAVDDAVRDAVGGAVRDAVHDAVHGAVDDAVRDAVHDAVHGAVHDAVGGARLLWHWWFGGQFWVGGWWGSPSSVSFFVDVCGLKLNKDMSERADAYKKVCESVNYFWTNEKFVIVCARPKHILRNNQGQLHSDTDKAIEYPDGWGLYMLNGVRFHETLWRKITSKTISFEEVLKIEDIDQRKQAMKYCNVWEFVKYANGKEIDTHLKVGKDGRKIRYWLFKFPQGEIFDRDVTYAIYDDSMMGAAEQHMQGVPNECNTVADAFAWKQSDELYTVSPEKWLDMELDVDFT